MFYQGSVPTIPPVDPRPVSASRTVLSQWMGPTDANVAGSVHGGAVMRLCDEAAGTAAARHCRQMVVTAAMGRMTFLLPIRVGQLLTFRASVNAVWRTSLEIGVRVEAEDIATGTIHHTNSAYLTMVAIDAHGRPVEVPPLLTEDDQDRRREREAQLRRSSALAEREAILAERAARGEPLP
jgi:acyl-CoA hydrolase